MSGRKILRFPHCALKTTTYVFSFCTQSPFDLSNFEMKHIVEDVEFKMGQMVCWEISVVVGNNGPQFD